MTPEEKRRLFPITLPLSPFYKLFMWFSLPAEWADRATSRYLNTLRKGLRK